MKTKAVFLAGFLLGLSLSASARPPALVDPQTGRFLGNLSANPHDPNSTSNPYGQYGSRYGNTINNPYSQYGSPYSPNSPNNPHATGGYGAPASSGSTDGGRTNNAPPVALPALPGIPGF